jgi:hypothetical protein
LESTEVVGDELRLVQPGGSYAREGWFYFSAPVLYPEAWTFRLVARVDAVGISSDPALTDMADLWDAQIHVSAAKAVPLLNSPWFQPLQTAAPLAANPSSFVPLAALAATDIEARMVTWAVRLISRDPRVTPSVRSVQLVVDHHERTEWGNDVAVGTGGKRIDFASSFYAAPSVAVTINNGQPGDRLVKTADRDHFTVEIFDSGGASVDRAIDWQAAGFGRGTT